MLAMQYRVKPANSGLLRPKRSDSGPKNSMEEQNATKNPDNARLMRVKGSFQLCSRFGIAGRYMSVEIAAMAVKEPKKTITRTMLSLVLGAVAFFSIRGVFV